MNLPMEWLNRLAPEIAEQADRVSLLRNIEALVEQTSQALEHIQGVNAIEPAVVFLVPEEVQP